MKYIQLLQPIALKTPALGAVTMIDSLQPTKEPEQIIKTHKQWLFDCLTDTKFGTDVKKLLQAAKIQKLILEVKDQAAANGMLVLEDADYDELKAVVDKPTGGYDMRWSISLLPFVNSVLNAPSEDPRKKLENGDNKTEVTTNEQTANDNPSA